MLTLLLTLIFNTQSVASAMSYERVQAPSPVVILALEESLRGLGFQPYFNRVRGEIPFIGVDQVFEKKGEYLLVFVGLEPKDLPEVWKIEQGTVFHKTGLAKTPVALLAWKAKRQTILDLKKLDLHPDPTEVSFFSKYIFPRAHAATCDAPAEPFPQTTALAEASFGPQVMAQADSCARAVLASAKDEVIGTISMALKGIKNLFTRPRELWRDVTENFSTFLDAVKNLKDNIGEVVKSLVGLPVAVVQEIVCALVGSALPKLLVPGAGWAKLATTVPLWISKIEKLKKVFEISARVRKPEIAREAIAPALACGI